MVKTKTDELRAAMADFERCALVLRSQIHERQGALYPRSLIKWALSIAATITAIAAAGIAVYVVAMASPARAISDTIGKPLVAARVFALLPDGNVEWSDPSIGPRTFRWDGRQWLMVPEITGFGRAVAEGNLPSTPGDRPQR